MEERHFYREQKFIYRKVYETLVGSAFPYSSRQRGFLTSFRAYLEEATGNPSHSVDIQIVNDLCGLMDSLENDDHINDDEPHRFYVDCTIEYHVQMICDELQYVALDETTRVLPLSVTGGTLVNIASFVSNRLSSIFSGVHPSQFELLYHVGIREIYNRMITIFQNHNLTYSEHQLQLMREIHEFIDEFRGTPGAVDYDDLHLRILGFMDSLRQNHPEREQITANGNSIVDPNGPITRAVDLITIKLLNLAKVTADHFRSFRFETLEIPDMIQTVVRHFLRFYPPLARAHNTSTSRPGSSSHI